MRRFFACLIALNLHCGPLSAETVEYRGPSDGSLSGSFHDSENWLPQMVPGPEDLARFSSPSLGDPPERVGFEDDVTITRQQVQAGDYLFDLDSKLLLLVPDADIDQKIAREIVGLLVENARFAVENGRLRTVNGPFAFQELGASAFNNVLVGGGGELSVGTAGILQTDGTVVLGDPSFSEPQRSAISITNGALALVGLNTILSPGVDFSAIGDGMTSELTVRGEGSQWKTGGSLEVGLRGTGKITVEDGGRVSSDRNLIAVFAGTTGAIHVRGQDSRLEVLGPASGQFLIGNGGEGLLEVTDGAQVVAGGAEQSIVILGVNEGSTGRALLDGSGSLMEAEQVNVGRWGNGELTISNGASLFNSEPDSRTQTASVLGVQPTGAGKAIVTGAGSQWIMADGAIRVGFDGQGVLTITNGASVSSFGGSIGSNTGSQGHVTVSGAGSNWNSQNTIDIGLDSSVMPGGDGRLTILNNGMVESTFTRVGPEGRIDGNGVLVGGVSNDGAISPGAPSGVLTVQGTYTQNADGQLSVEISQLASNSDVLAVAGEARLNGTLNIELREGFVAVAGTDYTVLSADMIQGRFSQVDMPQRLNGEPLFDVVYGDEMVFLRTTTSMLVAGDGNMDVSFDQLDLVQVQIAAKYLTGQAATWGEGDWNGAPGGEPGLPPDGDGLFNQLDIISALTGGAYLTGPYGATRKKKNQEAPNTTLFYDASTGDLRVATSTDVELTSISITSASALFQEGMHEALEGTFDSYDAEQFFKATVGGSFGDLELASVLPVGLSEEVIATDLSIAGSTASGESLGQVELIYLAVPEPSTCLILLAGLGALAICGVPPAR